MSGITVVSGNEPESILNERLAGLLRDAGLRAEWGSLVAWVGGQSKNPVSKQIARMVLVLEAGRVNCCGQ